MGRYRVAWKSKLTNLTGHGEWTDKKNAEAWVAYSNDPQNYRRDDEPFAIYWVEEEKD